MNIQNWDDLRFLLAVSRWGSFSAAARALKVSQPTVGRRIEQLEQQVGQKLFERDTQGFHLNETGAAVLRFAEAMNREAEGVGNYLTHRNRTPRTTVRIATTFNLATFWLTRKLAEFSRGNEQIQLAVQVGLSRADVQRYSADIALRMGDPGDETLFGRRVGQIHCGLYATREYLAAFGEPEVLSQLRQHRIVGSEGAVEKLPQCAVLRDAVANARCDFCADNTNVQLAAVRAGFGIAALPCLITRHEPTLKRVLAHSFDVPVDLWVLVNRNLKGTGPVRETYDFILREAVKDANLLKGAA
ncbi:MAG: LysR family transcriptional regulator [Minwuiales bacterium]|nr:LysR family transcriptional regulator [Minwuiales bacterium]